MRPRDVVSLPDFGLSRSGMEHVDICVASPQGKMQCQNPEDESESESESQWRSFMPSEPRPSLTA